MDIAWAYVYFIVSQFSILRLEKMGILDRFKKRKPTFVEQLKKERDIGGLIGALDSSDYSVQQEAIRALGVLGDYQAIPSLLNLLARIKHDDTVRMNVIDALGRISDPQAVEPIINILEQSSNHILQMYAATALGNIGDREAVEPLIKALSQALDLDPTLMGAFGMRSYSDQAHNEFIKTIALLRMAIAKALGKIGDSRAVEVLQRAIREKPLGDVEPGIRKVAEEALDKIKKSQGSV